MVQHVPKVALCIGAIQVEVAVAGQVDRTHCIHAGVETDRDRTIQRNFISHLRLQVARKALVSGRRFQPEHEPTGSPGQHLPVTFVKTVQPAMQLHLSFVWREHMGLACGVDKPATGNTVGVPPHNSAEITRLGAIHEGLLMPQ